MRELIIKADIKLLSLNKAFVALRNGRRIRSKEYTKFSNEIKKVKSIYAINFKAFELTFNPKKHEIHAELIYITPELYTKAGTISRNSGDLGNCEKCLTDCILDGAIDDCFITKWDMQKVYGKEYGFWMSLKIVDR